MDRVLSLDFASQSALAETFFEVRLARFAAVSVRPIADEAMIDRPQTWRVACAEKDIGLLASICETLLARETKGLLHALLDWAATGYEAIRALARDGIHFLESFDDDGYGDSQSTLLQYAQISACIQLLVRRHSVRLCQRF